MKKNIGTMDRMARVVIGLAACVSVFCISSVELRIVLAILGIFSMTEALLSRCVVYALLGRNTCPIE